MVICSKSPRRLPPGRRAVREDLKDLRRDEILAAALRLFRRKRYEDIGIAEVARESRIAKGTVYLYFRTKEAIFLALLEREFCTWFDELDALVAAPVPKDPAAAFVERVVEGLRGRAMFLRLIAVMHSVLEQNLDLDTALAFKRGLAQRARSGGAALEPWLGLASGAGPRLLLWLQALVIGLQHLSEPAPAVRQAMQKDALLQLFVIDFSEEMRALLPAAISRLQRQT